jgi:hypothetical protein
MALTNNFLPQTSLVFSTRDFVPQIDAIQKSDTAGLQNAFKFGTKLVDFLQSNKQADLMEKDTADRKALEQSIADDEATLAELKKQLATLQGGV